MAFQTATRNFLKLISTEIPTSARRGIITTSQNGGFFNPGPLVASKTGHSTLLSDDNYVYEIVRENVKPVKWDDYLKYKADAINMEKEHQGIKGELVGSWQFIAGGVQYRAFHMYKYANGWSDIDETLKTKKNDEQYRSLIKPGLPYVTQVANEFVKGFSYWPAPDARTGGNIYDVRSYLVKPGSMYDWGNYWAKGIKCRLAVRPDIPYCGMFAQIGQLHVVYHMWCYEDMKDRKSCREDTWHTPEWSNVVSNTVPLVRNMKTRVMEPLPFSPTQ